MSGKCCDVPNDYQGNCPVHYRCPGFILVLTRQQACELFDFKYGEYIGQAKLDQGFLSIENNRYETSTYTQISLQKLLKLPPDARIIGVNTRWGNLELDINMNSKWNHEYVSLSLLRHFQETGEYITSKSHLSRECICGDRPNEECPVHPVKCCERDTDGDGDCPVHKKV